MPKIGIGENQNNDYSNIMLLGYYRNALNYVFFNESIIVCSLFSLGAEEIWQTGTSIDVLFERACYLSEAKDHKNCGRMYGKSGPVARANAIV